ncbi:uncharacterized protein LOC112246913 isoform X2 [Oncorhynchus tshawytscha]|uniref:uncharacterized protein LOC112246913 isoform X2 n=1 Tax=Oncorhynchus tshawytscha TaxID=74940 RepID=UPI001C3CD417|nr:uncharacterized protein LOC112246913 isoform X2 [Oncorhynchus tshawytscha]
MASVSDLQARRVENNNTRTLLNSECVYEAAEDNSSQIILENPDPDIVKTISHYFDAALSGQKYVLSHPVTDHGAESSADRDSGDSLFITQVPVSEVVRSVRRCHSKERSEFTCTIESEEESGDEDGPATPQRKQQVSQAMKHHKRKAEKHGLKKYSFPFLGSVYRSKPLSSRECAYRNTHLSLLNGVAFSSKAIGGFFRCVKTLKKFSKGKATLASALPNRYLDKEGELSPLSEQEVESEGSDDDIRVVENKLLMLFLKKKNSQTWCYPSSEAEKQFRNFSSVSKDSTAKTKKQSTKKTQHLPHVKQTLSLVSKMIKDTPSKQSFAGSQRIVPEKCNMAEEETNPESVSCVRRCSSGRGLVRNKTEEPGIHLADNTDGQEENDNMDISLTEWKTMLNIGFVSEEVEGSRIDQAVDITSSPINEVQESEGSCLERTQGRAMTPSVTGQRPDRDHQNQTRETEADPGIKGHNPPSTDPALTNDCTNVDAGGDYEQKGKKRKKKNRKREGGDDESIEDRVGQPPCQEAPDYQELVTCVSTSTIQGGEATEITQDNKAEHSVSVSGEMIMPQKKKRKKERRRDSPCHVDTDICLRREENPKKKRRKRRISSTEDGAVVQQQEDNIQKSHISLKSSVSESIDTVPPRKKGKKDGYVVTPLSTEERCQKDSIPPETDEITSPRKKKKKRDESKDTCSVIHQDTAAPLEKEIIGISLEGCESSALTPDDTVSQRKTKKNKNSLTKHDPEGRLKNDATKISQRMNATVKNSAEVRLEAESAFISSERKRKKTKRRKSTDYEVPAVGHQDNDNTAMLIETTQSSMTQYKETESQKKKNKINDNTAMLIEMTQSSMTQYTETESKKKKKINDNTAMLIETTQSSMTQYTETDSQKKKKKKKKKKINRKTNKESVAPKHTDGRQTGEMSEATSGCLPLPQINPDPVSISHEFVSSAEKKNKKNKKNKHGKDKRMMYV